MGVAELEELNIYSMAQDHKGKLWLSTNGGLVSYDGYETRIFGLLTENTPTLFSVTVDSKNNIYAITLTGAIYQLKNDTLRHYFTLPKELRARSFQISTTKNDDLIIISKQICLLNQQKNLNVLTDSANNFVTQTSFYKNELYFITVPNGKPVPGSRKVLGHLDSEHNISEITSFDINDSENIPRRLSIFNGGVIYQSNKDYVFLKKNGTGNYDRKILDLENDDQIIKHESRFMEIDRQLWLFDGGLGAFVYDTNGQLIYGETKIFLDKYITCLFVDKDQNTWVGSAGKGLFCIPKNKSITYVNHAALKDKNVNVMHVVNDNELYIGTAEGQVYHLKDNDLKLVFQHTIGIGLLRHKAERNLLVINTFILDLKSNKVINSLSKTRSTYSWQEISPTIDIIGTNFYFYKIDYSADKVKFELLDESGNKLGKGAQYMCFDKKYNYLYFLTNSGLFRKHIDSSFISPVYLKGKQLHQIPTYINGLLYINNFDKLYITDNMVIQDSITVDDGLNNHYIYSKERKGKLYVVNGKSFQCFNPISKNRLLNITNGPLTNRVSDFQIYDKNIWFIGNYVLHKAINKELDQKATIADVVIDAIFINGKKQYDVSNSFLPSENNITFKYFTSSYQHEGNVVYEYRLKGLDDKWLAVDFNQNIINYHGLSPGTYTFEIKAYNGDQIASMPTSYSFTIGTPWHSTWWFRLIVATALCIAIYLIYRNLKRTLALERDINMAKINAIKAQMNPHFVFNALNSVQDLIMQKDILNSNIYLGKFADLMRQTLDYSQLEHISVKKELDTAILYLDLEKLRFGKDFSFNVNTTLTDDELNDLDMPSLLLQPYLENAIKHGLLHKEGDKELNINIEKKTESFSIEILDNGVGRAKSAEINERRSKGHHSFAMSANKQRLKLIKQSTGKEIIFAISDIEPTGTRVSFTFRL